MQRSVLVLGGGGFIGRRTVEMLLAAGWAVRVGSRALGSGAGNPALVNCRVNLADSASIRRAAEGVDGVIHLANGACASWEEFKRDYEQGSENVARAALDKKVKRVVYVSSIAALYMGSNRTIQEADGTDARPQDRAFYSQAKILAELVFQNSHKRDGLDVVIVRPAVVMGRGGMINHSGFGYWPNDIHCIGWGSGTTHVPVVLVDDVARGLVAALETPGIGGKTFNLAGDLKLSAREYVKLLTQHSPRRFEFFPQHPLKLQAIDVVKWVLKCVARKPGNTFPSLRDLKSRSLSAHIDCSAAKSLLHWHPEDDLEVFVREVIQPSLAQAPRASAVASR